MTGRIPETSPRRAAQIAGVGYLIIFVLALFANFVVVNGLIESGDAAATAANITDSEGLFRWGIVAFAVVFVVDVVIAWALYLFFKSLSRELSLLTAWFRLVYTVFLGVGLVFLFQALRLLGGADYLAAFDQGQREAQTMVSLDAFDYVWRIGLVAFGVHLILLGYLVVRSGYVTRLLGYVVMVAGAAYVVGSTDGPFPLQNPFQPMSPGFWGNTSAYRDRCGGWSTT